MDRETPKRAAHIRVRGGQIPCAACGRAVGEVVLLERGRTLCLGCAGEQAGVSIETIREWLRSGQPGGVLP